MTQTILPTTAYPGARGLYGRPTSCAACGYVIGSDRATAEMEEQLAPGRGLCIRCACAEAGHTASEGRCPRCKGRVA